MLPALLFVVEDVWPVVLLLLFIDLPLAELLVILFMLVVFDEDVFELASFSFIAFVPFEEEEAEGDVLFTFVCDVCLALFD